MIRGVIVGVMAAVLIGLALRGPELGRRPLHTDEAVNAIKFRALLEQGLYRYDPEEHHGPALFYGALAWARLTGATDFDRWDEAAFRRLTVLFGAGMILLTNSCRPCALSSAATWKRPQAPLELADGSPACGCTGLWATGDLAYKQIFPSLQGLIRAEGFNLPIIGVSRTGSLDKLTESAKGSLEKTAS